jgi:hypothetical protein
MRSLARATVVVLGVGSLPAVFWAFFNFLPLISDLFVLRRASAYVPAVFEVEWARLDDGTPMAVGTIAGRREVMSLGDVLPRRPTGLNDLQDLMVGKERMDVLYDAGGTATGFEGRRIRVLAATEDLRSHLQRRLTRTLLVGYGPALLLVGLGVLVSRLAARSMGCWLAPSLFFLAAQPIFAVFVIATELLQ